MTAPARGVAWHPGSLLEVRRDTQHRHPCPGAAQVGSAINVEDVKVALLRLSGISERSSGRRQLGANVSSTVGTILLDFADSTMS